MKAKKVIKAFGGEQKLAELLGINESTVYRWNYTPERGGTGGYVPTRNIPRIKELAEKMGIDGFSNE